jgi:hypothetical protein
VNILKQIKHLFFSLESEALNLDPENDLLRNYSLGLMTRLNT